MVGYNSDLVDYVGALTTVDAKRKYIHLGKAFYADFYDTISANGVYTFLGTNTGAKDISIEEIYFNPGNFLIEFVDSGTYTNGGNPYTMQNTVETASFNFNKKSSNVSTFKLYPQTPGLVRATGTVFAREYNQSPTNADRQWILGAGQSFTCQFKNLAASSTPYFLRMVWYEINQ